MSEEHYNARALYENKEKESALKELRSTHADLILEIDKIFKKILKIQNLFLTRKMELLRN